MQPYTPVGAGFQTHGRTVATLVGWAKAGREVDVGGVEPVSELAEVGLGRVAQTQGGEDLRPGLLPTLTIVQAGPRIAPSCRAERADVAAAQPAVSLQHAQRVGPVVDRFG